MTVVHLPSFELCLCDYTILVLEQRIIFEPLVDGEVGIYVCGITPYSPSHIGHARQALAFDIIVRWLRYSGFKVNHITKLY